MNFKETVEYLKVDLARVYKGNPTFIRILLKAASNDGFRAVFLYRVGRYWYFKKQFWLASLCERLMHHLCHCWIRVTAEIEPGLLIAHVGGIVVGGGTRIGKNCDIRQNITFGGNFSKKNEDNRTQPWVGNNVSVGVGAVIIGPIYVGNNVIIGANSVLSMDVPDNVIVSGIPAKVLKERWSKEIGRKL